MNEALYSAIHDRWPKILAPNGKKVSLQIEAGWNTLLDELCEQLQHYTDHEGAPQVEAHQIKEKFGGLRFYIGQASASQHALIRFAEGLSYRTCETCGAVGELYKTKRNWFTTKCHAHTPQGATPAVLEDASCRITVWLPTPEIRKQDGE
ncbi:hypothetical protein FNZ56_04145 [Pseudoluteimonas lycopersici]|uniref:Uncharacterized protein n=1 Tax=Pseudoluteimonas lycopersici TaxID=1324796 RepID=A0A516V3L6_9GAMM|nr:hypothetical protein [Lysobacter lycopersici]QDQ73121.1 hypothetical protein FNZ56_04145 [Lysobacter lycopersici]